MRAERERARFRLHLHRHWTAFKNRIHATLLAFGKPCPVSDLFGAGGRALLAGLTRRRVDLLRGTVEVAEIVTEVEGSSRWASPRRGPAAAPWACPGGWWPSSTSTWPPTPPPGRPPPCSRPRSAARYV